MVRVLRDLPYAGTTNPRQMLDLYLPGGHDTAKPKPLLVFIHGGAWLEGDKRQGSQWIRTAVESGDFLGASLNYRLSQEAIWPAQALDVKTAIRWLKTEGRAHGVDPDRIGVWGFSAGGHLACILGTTAGLEELEPPVAEGTAPVSSSVRCVINFFGPTDFQSFLHEAAPARINNPRTPEARLLGGLLSEKRDAARLASPALLAGPNAAPHLHVHGDKDAVVSYRHALLLHERLKTSGVPSTLVTVRNGGHGGFRNPEIYNTVRRFTDLHLRDIPAVLSDQSLPSQ